MNPRGGRSARAGWHTVCILIRLKRGCQMETQDLLIDLIEDVIEWQPAESPVREDSEISTGLL